MGRKHTAQHLRHTYILTELSDQYFMFSKIIVSVIVAVFWNYQMQYRFVFNSKNK